MQHASIAPIAVIAGLIVGSFLNAVLYRLPRGISALSGRSYCPHCKHVLSALDLVPLLSFVMLAGRCRYCRRRISWQYPVIELITGIAFLLIYLQLALRFIGPFDLAARFIIWAVFVSYLIVIFVYDLRHYLILDKVVVPAAAIAFVCNIMLGATWWKLIAAAAVVAGFFALQYFISRGTWIGGGDIRLGALMGIMLSWPQALIALIIAYLAGGLVAGVLLATKRANLGSKVPFGTFLTFATFVTLLWGREIVSWYLNIL